MEKGKTYYQDFKYNDDYKLQENELLKYLKTIKFNSVLEFGCGFGRITKLILDNCHPGWFTAVDLSQEQLDHVCYTDETWRASIETYPYSRKFDLVIAVEVLMHQLPDKVQSIIDKMISLSNKHVINVDYYSEKYEELAPHNFNHDYFSLYNNNVTMVKIGKQALFHYETV